MFPNSNLPRMRLCTKRPYGEAEICSPDSLPYLLRPLEC